MKRCLLAIILSFSVLAPAGAQTGIRGILANPQSYDGQHVTVVGVVARLQSKTSARGNPYETFNLCDGTCLHVFTFGQPTSISNGSRVTVSGTYSAVKRVGRYTFRTILVR